MRWANPNALYALLVIPVLVVILILSSYITKKKFRLFAEDKFYGFFLQNFSSFHWHLKNYILLIPLVLMVIAAARPQWGKDIQVIHKEGLDIAISVDVSLSMLATDIRPNRLQRTKDQISYFLDQLQGDRLALLPFARTSFIKLPMTDDYQAAKMFLNIMDTNSVPVPGTDVGEALLTAETAFPDPDRNKIIILISDGDDLEERGVEIAKEIGQKGIKIYTLGIGTPDGSPIKIKNEDGVEEYIRDGEGNIVISQLDVDVLGRIAQHGNGQFFMVTPQQSEIYEILRDIEEIERERYDAQEFIHYRDRYRPFAIAALIIILIEMMLLYRKKNNQQN